MLKEWKPAKKPDKEELKERLRTGRKMVVVGQLFSLFRG